MVTQRWRQDLLLSGFLRILGTVVGAGISLSALRAAPVESHPLLIALSIGLFVSMAYWIGTVYSYGALLVAVTVPVVLVPSFIPGPDVYALALDRFLCTLIGVVCVTVITFSTTPRRDAPSAPHPQQVNFWHIATRGGIAFVLSLAGCYLTYLYPSFVNLSITMALCIFSAVLGSMPDPTLALRFLGKGVVLGVLGAVAYRGLLLWLSPALPLHLLIASLFIALGAVLRADPRISALRLDYNMCFLLVGEVGGELSSLRDIALGGLALGLVANLIVALYRWIPQAPSKR